VGVPTKRKGVRQLIHSIQSLFDKNSSIESELDVSRVTKVYPVLVIHDDLGGAWFLNAYLEGRFRSLLAAEPVRLVNKRGSKVRVAPLSCISADHLEIVATSLRTRSFSEILKTRYQREPQLNLPFLLVRNPALDETFDGFPAFLRDATSEMVSRLRAHFPANASESCV
jgi:hypothetical protein